MPTSAMSFLGLVRHLADVEENWFRVSLDRSFAHPHDGPVSLRWILTHMIEEYARHNGHAGVLREAIDGAVGK